jgi:hypothetical protein
VWTGICSPVSSTDVQLTLFMNSPYDPVFSIFGNGVGRSVSLVQCYMQVRRICLLVLEREGIKPSRRLAHVNKIWRSVGAMSRHVDGL